jgi:hypothetical protein
MTSPPGMSWGYSGSQDTPGIRGNEIAGRLARSGSRQRFIGPEPFLGVSRQNIRRNVKGWIGKKYLALWCEPCGTQRQVR